MEEVLNGLQFQNNNWVKTSLIEVHAMPDRMGSHVLDELIFLCNEWDSVELLLKSNSQKDGLQVFMILRMRDKNQAELQKRADMLLEKLMLRLGNDGFDAEILADTQQLDLLIRVNDQSYRLLCLPGENRFGQTGIYCPGGYSLVRPLDIDFLLCVLREYTGASISLQISKTAYTFEERQMLEFNRQRMSTEYGNTESGMKAVKIFTHFLQQQNEPHYLVTLSIWGQENNLTIMSNSIHRSGYELVQLPEPLYAENNYIASGDALLAEYAQTYCHVIEYDCQVPFEMKRLNYLTREDGIRNMLQHAFSGSTIKGHETHAHAGGKELIPPELKDKDGVLIGQARGSEQTLRLPLSQLTRHMVVAGMPGSGKTNFLFGILDELAKKDIPFLVIEPTKTEYRELIDAIPDIKILTPGRTEVNPIMFNPFLPPRGITLEQFLPSLISAFQMAFSMTTPLDVIFPEALRNCYAAYGWRNNSTSDDKDVKVFGMNEFIGAFKAEIAASSYDEESKQNLNSGGVYRLQSLMNTNPYLFDTDCSLAVEKLLNGYTVIELDAIDSPEHKSLLLAMLLLHLKLVIRKKQKKDSKLKNVLLIDEAHVLLDTCVGMAMKNEADPTGKLREFLLDMVKVNRAYGTGMIFSDQSLAVLKDFVNNSNVKIIMHVESAEDRAFLTQNLNLTQRLYEQIRDLKTGEYYLSFEKTEQPLLVMAPDNRKTLKLTTDVEDNYLHKVMDPFYEKPFAACTCRKHCNPEIRTEGEFIARNLIQKMRPLLHDKEALVNYMKLVLPDAIAQMAEGDDEEKKLSRCAKMQLERLIRIKITSDMIDIDN